MECSRISRASCTRGMSSMFSNTYAWCQGGKHTGGTGGGHHHVMWHVQQAGSKLACAVAHRKGGSCQLCKCRHVQPCSGCACVGCHCPRAGQAPVGLQQLLLPAIHLERDVLAGHLALGLVHVTGVPGSMQRQQGQCVSCSSSGTGSVAGWLGATPAQRSVTSPLVYAPQDFVVLDAPHGALHAGGQLVGDDDGVGQLWQRV